MSSARERVSTSRIDQARRPDVIPPPRSTGCPRTPSSCGRPTRHLPGEKQEPAEGLHHLVVAPPANLVKLLEHGADGRFVPEPVDDLGRGPRDPTRLDRDRLEIPGAHILERVLEGQRRAHFRGRGVGPLVAAQQPGQLRHVGLHVVGPARAHESVVELRHGPDETLGLEFAHAVDGNDHVDVLLEPRPVEVRRQVTHHQLARVDVGWNQAELTGKERVGLVAPALDTGGRNQRDPALRHRLGGGPRRMVKFGQTQPFEVFPFVLRKVFPACHLGLHLVPASWNIPMFAVR